MSPSLSSYSCYHDGDSVILWLGCCNVFRLGLMIDGGRIAASDLNKEKKEVVALIQAQEFTINDACPIKTIGGKQIAIYNVLDVMHIFVNHMARLTLSS